VLLHTGLDDAQLGPRLARLLAPSSPLPAREMVARGLAPLVGSEPWLALYQLWVRGGATLADQASRTAGELPLAAVMTALADPHLPTAVLDFMARRRIRSPETLRLVVHHPRVHDATLQALARCAPEGVCGALAKNQRRWLVCPQIAEQLVRNSCCDRATAHAVLELGAREGVAGLAELRRQALAGADLQDGPEAHARATAWMLRSGPGEPFPDLSAPPRTPARAAPRAEAEGLDLPAPNMPLRPGTGNAGDPRARPGLALRPGSWPAPERAQGLSLRPGGPAPEPPQGLSLRPGGPAPEPPQGLSLRPGGPVERALGLSSGPGAAVRPAPARPDAGGGPADLPGLSARPGEVDAAPTRPRGLSFQAGLPLDELDELDLPIADDWDEVLDPADVPPPALREAVSPALSSTAPPTTAPDEPAAAPDRRPPAPADAARDRRPSADAGRDRRPPASADAPRDRRPPAVARAVPGRYAERVELVLDPATPLTLAMSLLHRLRPPDLRRVAAARRLSPALVAAARRRVGAP